MKPIKALANADEVVRLLAKEGELPLAEIAELLKMPRSSVYRLLDGLNAIGLTESLPDSKARLSLRWLHLADRARESITEWRDLQPALAEIVERTGQTAFFCVKRNDEAVCLEWEQGRGIGILVLRPGGSLPLYAGAAGRILLAFSADLDDYLQHAPFNKLTAKTLVSAKSLRTDAANIRTHGFALSDEDVTKGISAIGVPVMGETGETGGALSLAGLRTDILDRKRDYLATLREIANRIGAVQDSVVIR